MNSNWRFVQALFWTLAIKFCKYAKSSLGKVTKQPLRYCEASFAAVQSQYCREVILALQNGRTGSFSSKSVIKESHQGVSLEESASTPLTMEVD